jgi:hypothetical protein
VLERISEGLSTPEMWKNLMMPAEMASHSVVGQCGVALVQAGSGDHGAVDNRLSPSM